MERETNGSHRKPAIGPVPVADAAAARPLLLWRGLLLVGLVLIVGSGFRLAEPALDAVRGGSGADAAAELPDIPPPPPPPAPTGPTTGLPPALVEQPVVVINDPVRLRIRRIGVDAPITHLGLAPDGSIAVPKAWGDVGWFDRGPAPGGIGPSVLVGHYDSTTGPAVFYRLPQFLPGDRVEVAGRTGVAQAFIVDRTEDVSKAAFPSQRVYGPVTRPELRLITCGGAFDHKTKHYLNNIVVYAHADTFADPPAGAAAVSPAPVATVPPSVLHTGTLVPSGAGVGAVAPAAGALVPAAPRGVAPAAPTIPAAGVGAGQGIPPGRSVG